MKNNTDLRAALNTVLARLDADPKSPEEWQAIRNTLEEAFQYATKCKDLRIKFRDRYPQAQEPRGDGSASIRHPSE